MPRCFGLTSAVGLLAAAAVTVVPGVALASAPQPCTAQAVLPSRVVVATESVTIGGSSISVYAPGAPDDALFLGHFDLKGQGITLARGATDWHAPQNYGYRDPTFLASNLRPGAYTAIGVEANIHSLPEQSCTWTDTSTVIKFGGNAGIGSSRAGKVVTLFGLFHEYRAGGFAYPVGRTEYLQRYRPGVGWQNIAATTVQTGGRAAISFVDALVGEYRWASIDNALTFGFTSPVGFR